jgi:hypothetical protein
MDIFGIDFSGAVSAGRKIWMAKGADRGGVLNIEGVGRAGTYTGANDALHECLVGLREFIRRQTDAAFGCDFPFGLPWSLTTSHTTWEEFILAFPQEYDGASDFRERFFQQANAHELRRHTDEAQRTPWSPYNLRLYRQSYYGLSELLAPLVQQGAVSVLPMQRTQEGKPWLLEVCPASRLRRLKVNRPYKRTGEAGRAARSAILAQLLGTGVLVMASDALCRAVIDDPEGDALDSVIAAWATADAVREPPLSFSDLDEIEALEGYVYV